MVQSSAEVQLRLGHGPGLAFLPRLSRTSKFQGTWGPEILWWGGGGLRLGSCFLLGPWLFEGCFPCEPKWNPDQSGSWYPSCGKQEQARPTVSKDSS